MLSVPSAPLPPRRMRVMMTNIRCEFWEGVLRVSEGYLCAQVWEGLILHAYKKGKEQGGDEGKKQGKEQGKERGKEREQGKWEGKVVGEKEKINRQNLLQ